MNKISLVLCLSVVTGMVSTTVLAQASAPLDIIILTEYVDNASNVDHGQPKPTKVSKREWCHKNPKECKKHNYQKAKKANSKKKLIEDDVWCEQNPGKCAARKEEMDYLRDRH